MCRTIATVVVAVFLFAAANSNAEERVRMPGNDVLVGCEELIEGKTTFSSGYCIGIIAGVRGAQRLEPASADGPQIPHEPLFCVPDAAPNGDLVRMVVRYLHAHPKRLDEPFLFLAADALKQAFPCKK